MANASPTTVRAGWLLFRESGFELTRQEINLKLREAGLGEISPRTHDHYRQLGGAGYARYVSINRFDVARASRPYENTSASGRYRYYEASGAVVVSLARNSRIYEAIGQVLELGEVGVVVEFSGEMSDGVTKTKLTPDDYVRLVFSDGRGSFAARVLEALPLSGNSMAVEFEFTRLHSVLEYTESAVSIERSRLTLVPDADSDLSADLIGRRLFFLLELFENARSFTNDVLEPIGVRYAPVEIETLRMASPLVIVLAAPGVVVTVGALIWQLVKHGPDAFNAIADGQLKRAQARKLDQETKIIASTADLDNAWKVEQLKTHRVREQLTRAALRGSKRHGSGEPDPLRLDAGTERLLDSAVNLSRQSIASLVVRALPPGENTEPAPTDGPSEK